MADARSAAGPAVGILSVVAGVGVFQRGAWAWRVALIAVAVPPLPDSIQSTPLGLLLPPPAPGEGLDPWAFHGGLASPSCSTAPCS